MVTIKKIVAIVSIRPMPSLVALIVALAFIGCGGSITSIELANGKKIPILSMKLEMAGNNPLTLEIHYQIDQSFTNADSFKTESKKHEEEARQIFEYFKGTADKGGAEIVTVVLESRATRKYVIGRETFSTGFRWTKDGKGVWRY